MAADGTIKIYTNVDTNGIRVGRKNIESAMSGIGSTVKKIGGMIAAAFAVQKVVQFGKECLDLGSDLQEVQNVVDSVFTTMSGKVDDFAKSAAKNFGLSETMAKQYAGSFGAMAKSFGFAEGEALNMATALTGLSGDVASFYNLSQDEAYTKLKSVFTGETESLKELGVVMTQSALDSYAMANGFGKTTSAMTEQEKVALRYRFVMDQLSTASGDFLRTSDGWANQVRVLKLQIDSLKATIGQGLINIFTPVIKVINTLLAKLATVADAFKSFTELITGKKSQPGSSTGITQDAIPSVGEGYNQAADGADKLANSTKKAAEATKDAEKAAKGYLSPIDEINKIGAEENLADAINPDVGSGSLGDQLQSAVGNVDYGKLAEGETVLDKTGSAIDAIIKKMKQLAKLFKKGFWDGLGDYKPILDDLKSDIKSIGKSMKDIFTSPEVLAAADNFAKTLSYSLGQLAGSFARIGLTVAQNLVGGIEKYLSQNTGRIKQYLVGMLDIGSEIAGLVGDLGTAIADIFSVFGSDTAQQITADIIGIFVEVRMMITETALKLGRDILNMIAQPFIDNKDILKDAIAGTLEAIEPFTSGFLTAIQTVRDAVSQLYDGYLKPLFDSIAQGLSTILTKLTEGYNTYILPVLQGLAEKFQELMEGPFGVAIGQIQEFLGKLIESLKLLWESVLVPFFSWLIENIFPILAPLVQGIGDVALTILEAIIKAIGNIADVLSGVIDFIVGVFTGDWEKAWEGIQTIFSSTWELIKGILEAVWEVIKTVIRTSLDVVKRVITTVWNGIKTITSTIWNGIKTTISTLWNRLKETAQTVFGEIGKKINDIWESIKTTAKTVWDWIHDKVIGVGEKIRDTVSGAFQTLRDNITGAFEGVVDFIKGILNGAIRVVNGAISKINGAISTVESALSFDVGFDAPWGSRVGVSLDMRGRLPRIDSLPYLATGAVIPPNAPFAAVVGDQKHGTNIEAPLETIKQAVAEVMGQGSGVYRVSAEVSGRTLLDIVIDEAELRRSRNGRNPFVLT